MKRIFFTALVSVLGIGLLSACGDKKEDSSSAEAAIGESSKDSTPKKDSASTFKDFLDESKYFVYVKALDKDSEIQSMYKFDGDSLTILYPNTMMYGEEFEPLTSLGGYSKLTNEEIEEQFEKLRQVAYKTDVELNKKTYESAQDAYNQARDNLKENYPEDPEGEAQESEEIESANAEFDNRFKANMEEIEGMGEIKSYPYTLNLVTDATGNHVDYETLTTVIKQTTLTLESARSDYYLPGTSDSIDRTVNFDFKAFVTGEIYDAFFSGMQTEDGYFVTKTENQNFIDFDSIDNDYSNVTVDE